MKKVICTDRDGGKYEVSIDKLSFRPAIYAVIIKNGSILLSKQWDGYDFSGGGVNLGEEIKMALIREVKEETGLKVKVGDIITCENAFFRNQDGDYRHSILMYYKCEIISGDLSIENIDEEEKKYKSMPEWIPFDDLVKIKFYNSVDSIEIVKKALEMH